MLSPPPSLSTKFAPLLSHSSHSIRCVDKLFQVTTGTGGPHSLPLPRSAARSAAKKKATTGPFSKLEKSQEEQVKVWFFGEDGHVFTPPCFGFLLKIEGESNHKSLTGHGRCSHQRSAALERSHAGRREGARCLQPAEPRAGAGWHWTWLDMIRLALNINPRGPSTDINHQVLTGTLW